jgi:phosphatidylinositol alpha-1,6-mannosyltransferase
LAKYPNVIYLILGDGAYRAPLEQMSRDLGVADCVRFLGYVSNVPAYLAAADLALLVSREEASPMSLLEYAASGLPVITSRHPPFDELVRREWARMVDEENATALTNMIDCLLANADLRSTMGRAGRAWVEQHHSWDQVARDYRALIG